MDNPPLSLEFYSETVGLDEEPGISSENILRILGRPQTALQPYLGFSNLNFEALNFRIHRNAPLIGLRWQPWSFVRMFAEYRHSEDSLARTQPRDDPRYGAILFYFHEFGTLSAGVRTISDSYGEAVRMDRYSHKPMFTAWSKLALRVNPNAQTFADLYGEAFVQETLDPALGRKAEELRGGMRAGMIWDNVSVTAQLFHRLVSGVDAPPARWRWLLAIGGRF